jgi:uncharacterized OsmC-like protein
MTIIGIRAKKREINVDGMLGSIEKTMTTNPRRIGKLEVRINLPKNLSLENREWLIKEGCDCPVCFSINQTMDVNIIFVE